MHVQQLLFSYWRSLDSLLIRLFLILLSDFFITPAVFLGNNKEIFFTAVNLAISIFFDLQTLTQLGDIMSKKGGFLSVLSQTPQGVFTGNTSMVSWVTLDPENPWKLLTANFFHF